MNRTKQAAFLHQKGYNCAQAVACTFADKTDVSEKTLFRLTEGFGLGMGDTSGTCGALSGAAVILSLMNSTGNMDGPYSKAATYKIMEKLSALFRAKNGATICRDLKGIDTKKPLRSCDGCIADATAILEKILGK